MFYGYFQGEWIGMTSDRQAYMNYWTRPNDLYVPMADEGEVPMAADQGGPGIAQRALAALQRVVAAFGWRNLIVRLGCGG